MEEYGLTGATAFWLFVPMISLVILSVITYFTERRD